MYVWVLATKGAVLMFVSWAELLLGRDAEFARKFLGVELIVSDFDMISTFRHGLKCVITMTAHPSCVKRTPSRFDSCFGVFWCRSMFGAPKSRNYVRCQLTYDNIRSIQHQRKKKNGQNALIPVCFLFFIWRRNLEFGLWASGFEFQAFGFYFEIRILGFGSWASGFGQWAFGHGLWDLGFGWVLGYFFTLAFRLLLWNLGFEIGGLLWVLGFGLWTSDVRFFLLGDLDF